MTGACVEGLLGNQSLHAVLSAPHMAARFKAAALESGEVSDEFCKALRRRQFVIVELDDDEAVDAIRSMWHAIDRVFALPAETKERVGGPYRAAPGCTREEVRGRVRAGIYAP